MVHVGINPVVGLDDRDPCAVRLANTQIAANAIAAVLLIDDANARILRGMALHDIERTIGAAVVDADDLEILMRLARDAIEALIEIFLNVIDRYDDRNERIFIAMHIKKPSELLGIPSKHGSDMPTWLPQEL